MTVLMAGCGNLGTEAGLRLAATGRRVLAVRRRTELLPAGIEGQSRDLSREVPDVPGDTEIVVIATTADQRDAEGYRSIYVDGLVNTLTGLERAEARPRRVLLVSSTAVHGVADGSWVDETSPAAPSSETGAVLAEAERLLHERLPGAVVLRLAGLYGPGRGRLIEQVRRGEATPSPAYTNRIHRDDAAAAIVHLTTAIARPQPVYLGVDNAPVTREEIIRFLAARVGVPAPAPEPAGDSAGKRCRNDRLVASDFTFTYPTYRQGYDALLAGNGAAHR